MTAILNKILTATTLAFLVNVFFYAHVSASQVFFGSTGREVGVGQLNEVGVFVDTQGEATNAFQGEIAFASDMLDIAQFRDGSSIVSLWIERPHIDPTDPGKIIFSGIAPGGYNGDKGMLFSFVLQPIKVGPITITSQNEQILRDDGEGTLTEVSRAPLTLIATTASSSAFFPTHDNDQPEDFKPIIGQHPGIFDGAYFVTFATQDKGSGVAEYAIAEERVYPWQKLFFSSRSREFVSAQSLRSIIYIKAIDNAGNERIVELSPTYLYWYEKYFVWCILCPVVFVVVIVLIRLYGGKKKN